MYKNMDKLVNKVLMEYGNTDQLIILIEECSELTKEICKLKRGKDEHIIEELTHVLISCEVCRDILGITKSEIEYEIKRKLDNI